MLSVLFTLQLSYSGIGSRGESHKGVMNPPCSAKYSGHIIFKFSADWQRTSKIKLREILEYRIDANGILDP